MLCCSRNCVRAHSTMLLLLSMTNIVDATLLARIRFIAVWDDRRMAVRLRLAITVAVLPAPLSFIICCCSSDDGGVDVVVVNSSSNNMPRICFTFVGSSRRHIGVVSSTFIRTKKYFTRFDGLVGWCRAKWFNMSVRSLLCSSWHTSHSY